MIIENKEVTKINYTKIGKKSYVAINNAIVPTALNDKDARTVCMWLTKLKDMEEMNLIFDDGKGDMLPW